MSSEFSQSLDELFRICDENDAATARLEARLAQREIKTHDASGTNIIYKTRENALASQPMMSPEVQQHWDRWCDSHVRAALSDFKKTLTQAIGGAMAEFVGEKVEREAAKLRAEIAALREEIEKVKK